MWFNTKRPIGDNALFSQATVNSRLHTTLPSTCSILTTIGIRNDYKTAVPQPSKDGHGVPALSVCILPNVAYFTTLWFNTKRPIGDNDLYSQATESLHCPFAYYPIVAYFTTIGIRNDYKTVVPQPSKDGHGVPALSVGLFIVVFPPRNNNFFNYRAFKKLLFQFFINIKHNKNRIIRPIEESWNVKLVVR